MALPRVISATAESSTRFIVQFDSAMNQDSELLDVNNYTLSPSIPDFSNATVTVLSSSSVAIDLTVNMLGGEQYFVEASQSITSVSGEILNFQYITATFVGIGHAPQIDSAIAVDKETILVQFSEPMRLAELSDSNNFYVASQVTGRSVAITSSSPVLDGDGFYRSTNLGIAATSKMTNDGQHLLEATGLYDVIGNAGQNTRSEFVGIADLPRLLDVSVVAEDKRLVLMFDSPMCSTECVSVGAFEIIPQDAGLPAGYYNTADVVGDGDSINLFISELRIGAPYDVVATSKAQDEYGNQVDPEYNSASFTGIGDSPTLDRAISVGQNRIDLVFSEPIRDNEQSRDVSRYSADNGLTFLSVLDIEGEVVKLVSSNQVSDTVYTVTVVS